jgi:lipopolysaccharide transport system ATP-binding protein
MTRREIQSKFDEIVDFAGVERYIDTPVKRYSSGMYVRLAFAVAAHLEPEILIVDEVLAVGDAEFQKKCLGKMKDVSVNQGRTVLFVSHNMPAITQLCNSAVLIKEGEVQKTGLADSVVRHYIATQSMVLGARYWEEKNAPGDDLIRLISCRVIQNQNSIDIIDINVDAEIEVTFRLTKNVSNLIPGINLYNIDEICVFDRCDWSPNRLNMGLYKKTLKIPAQTLAEGRYSVLVHLTFFDPLIISVVEKDTMFFEAIDSDNPLAVRGLFKGPWPGIVRLGLKWGEYEKFEN